MKHKLFRLQSLVAVALFTLMAMTFASCSDDDKKDDEPGNNSLAGTSWTILSDVDDATGETDDEVVGVVITFQKDGNLKFSRDAEWTYSKWSQNGNIVRITLGEGSADDYMEGTFIINGNKATYKYAWYDCDGEWGGEERGTTTLQKK